MTRASTDVEVRLAQTHQNPQSGRRSAFSGAENNALLAGFLRPLATCRVAREGGRAGTDLDGARRGHPLSRLINGQGEPGAKPM